MWVVYILINRAASIGPGYQAGRVDCTSAKDATTPTVSCQLCYFIMQDKYDCTLGCCIAQLSTRSMWVKGPAVNHSPVFHLVPYDSHESW